MHLGNRRTRAAGNGKRTAGHNFRPSGEWLEARRLLTTELAGNNASAMQLPAIANVPYGMDFGGANINPSTGGGTFFQGAGWSVADVGSVNGAPYDDFVNGAPTVGNTGGPPNILGSGAGSAVYLVLGSQTAPTPTINDWIGKTNNVFNYGPFTTFPPANNRVGDLGQIGAVTGNGTPQQNPITPTTGSPPTNVNLNLPFAGMALYTGSNANSNLAHPWPV